MRRLLTRLARTRVAPLRVLLIAGLLAFAGAGCDNPIQPSPPSTPPVVEEPPDPPAPSGLPPLTVYSTRFFAGGAPFEWRGLTAFDLPVRISEGDRRYLDWAADQGFTIVRVVPASKYRTDRTLDQGVAHLGPMLDAAAARGLYVEVSIGVDTALYGLTEAAFEDYVRRISTIVNARTNAVVELANEIGHISQARYLADVGLQVRLLELFASPGSAGSTHGGQLPRWDAGDYLSHHADRSRTPEENAAIMAAAQTQAFKPIVDGEALGIAAIARPGSRTNDPTYCAQQAQWARRYQLGGVTCHLDAGLDATVDRLDDVQREAARRFIEAFQP